MWFPAGLVKTDNPNVEYLSAKATAGAKLLIVLLNQMPAEESVRVQLDDTKVVQGAKVRWKRAQLRNGKLVETSPASPAWAVKLPAWGHAVLTLDYDEIKP